MNTVSVVSVVLAAPGTERKTELPCVADPELFFPVGTSGPALLQIAEAKLTCRGCPVEPDCRADALARPDHFEHGVVGGLSEDERRAIVRRRNRRRSRGVTS